MSGVHPAAQTHFFRWAMTFRQNSDSKIKPEATHRASPKTFSVNGGRFTLTCAHRMSEARGVVNGAIRTSELLFDHAVCQCEPTIWVKGGSRGRSQGCSTWQNQEAQ